MEGVGVVEGEEVVENVGVVEGGSVLGWAWWWLVGSL